MQDSTQAAVRPRATWLLVAGMLLALIAVLGMLVARQALAATPSGARLSLANPSATWVGPLYTPANSAGDRAACEVPGRCDEFDLYLDLPPTFTQTQQVTITLAISAPQGLDDYDLYVIGPNGVTVASGSTAFGAEENDERTAVICPQLNFTYTVQVVPFIIQGPVSQYTGTASIEVGPGTTCRPPAPVRASGGIGFDVNTVVDPQRQVGEPDIVWGPPTSTNALGDVLASGPWGASTEQSFVWISTDNGDTYNSVSKLRPDAGPGGGDTSTEIDDQNRYYFTDLEALQNVGAAVSTDGGNTWPRNSLTAYQPVVDRQWQALDNGTSPGPEDNTQFLTYRQTPLGSYLLAANDGLTYLPAQANPAQAINSGAPCGDLRFDHTLRYLYLPCASTNRVEVSYAHVDVGQRTGITFQKSYAGDALGDTGNLFPTLTVDRAGNVYVAYTDSGDFNTYLVYSTDHAQTWSDPIRLNGNQANTTIFPWIVAGEEGRVAVAYIATDQFGAPGPDSFPSWFNDKPASATVKWHLYVNYLENAHTPNPTIYQAQASQHPVHYGQVCTSGTLCLATGGDRTMADFLTIQHDNSGAMRIIYNDTTNQHHGASVMVASQIDGPSLFGTEVNGTLALNSVTDRTNDAQYPHRDPLGPGPNYDALDIKGVSVASNLENITVTMTISNLAATKVIPGADSVVWMARWQSKSVGDFNEESYRIYYAQAVSTLGGDPEFFYGTSLAVSGPDAGCTTTTPQTCKLLQYPQGEGTTGTYDEATGTITIVVPREGVGSPPVGSTLYSITGYTYGQRSATPDFYDDVDLAKAFNYTFQSGPEPPPVTCPILFQDVPQSDEVSSFYPFVRCLACRNILGGYPCGGTNPQTGQAEPCGPTGNPYYRPSNNITRGQISKIVSNSANFNEDAGGQIYADVKPGDPFYVWVNRLSNRHHMGGYPCGGPGEPCDDQNRPYFRPSSNATRGQLSKIVSNAAGFNDAPQGQTYTDVPPSQSESSYYQYIERLSSRGVMSGYPCGGPGEPCDNQNRPYFRPNSLVTRAQAAKIVANTYYPNCQTPARP
ncbi:MAG: S-layer homology domain-containing protein [Chloroflexota bacterium]|nr:S-layer homology domain-containing protein [Chloroflexota bacterium]MDQ5866603.1 S-layer homology domain-containing protein [Chloroflexota bacterium]